jgi:hypothetical protein
VTGGGDELAFPAQRRVQPAEQVVECRPQTGDLVAGRGNGQARLGVFGGDHGSPGPHSLHRSQCRSSQQVGAYRRGQENQWKYKFEFLTQVGHGRVPIGEADSDHRDSAAVAGEGGGDPYRTVQVPGGSMVRQRQAVAGRVDLRRSQQR